MELNIEYLYKGTVLEDYDIPIQTTFNDTIKIHYSLFIKDGNKINTPYDIFPFYFEELGYSNDLEDPEEENNGTVIKGLDKVITELKLGDFIRVEIPYGYAYGEKGIPGFIPEKCTLVYYLQLIYIERNDNIFKYPYILSLNKLVKSDNILMIKDVLKYNIISVMKQVK